VFSLSKPLITAHTGCMNTPPNSIQSVMEGIKAGADIIEVDIRSTKDGVVVLLHDGDLMTQSGMRRVQDLTFEELNHLTQHERVNLLEEVVPLIKENQRVINLDVKEDRAIDLMIQIIEKFNMEDHVIITGCEKERASYLKKNYRQYQVLLNASLSQYKKLYGDYQSFIKETIRDAISASCCGININYQLCNEELIDAAKLRCLPVFVWTVDDSKQMKTFLGSDVHSITSHEVETLYQLRELRSH
jgi:glycerophosphoryl diester phosphodiesterase